MNDAPVAAAPLPHRLELSALATLFRLTLRQQLRGRRLIVLCCLYLLPLGLVILIRSFESNFRATEAEIGLLFYLIPHTLVPLTALLYATGMIHDEIEDQTLTYLLVRPLPKWGIYLTKMVAVMLLTMVIATVFTTLTYFGVYWGEPELWGDIVPQRALQVSGITCLALVAYCSVFGCLGFLSGRPLVIGLGYIALFEGLLANFNFAVRRMTVNYYFRVLVQDWLNLRVPDWRLDPAETPEPTSCLLVLFVASVVTIVLAIRTFTTREFHVKTPEGS